MNQIKNENEINEVVYSTFERLVKMYHSPEESLLIIPKYSNNELRISEQEARFAFILELEKQGFFYFSVETPTEYAYSDFSTNSPHVNIRKNAKVETDEIVIQEQKTKNGMSGQHDVSLYELNMENTEPKFNRIVNIEFKSHQPEQKSITKDILKLYFEEADGVWVHLLQHSDRATLPALIDKLNYAINYAINYARNYHHTNTNAPKPQCKDFIFYIIILEKEDSNGSKQSRCLHCTIDASKDNLDMNNFQILGSSNSAKLPNSALNSVQSYSSEQLRKH